MILICSSKDVKSLRTLLDLEFHSKSNFPFTPFHIMNSLQASTQTALYKAHKDRTLGNDLVEITIPNFQDLETKITIDSSTRSLRDVCFDLKDQSGKNVFVDIDQSPRSSATILQVNKNNKDIIIEFIDSWVRKHLQISVTWTDSHQYASKTYRLDPESRFLANQLSEVAEHFLPPTQKHPLITSSSHFPSLPKKSPTNAWIDLTQMKSAPSKTPSAGTETVEEATVTTLSESTWHSSQRLASIHTKDKLSRLGANLKNLSYRHKKPRSNPRLLGNVRSTTTKPFISEVLNYTTTG